jgi:uncharacterized protein (TIRG00374 family)
MKKQVFFRVRYVVEHQKKTKKQYLSILLRAGITIIACALIAKKLDFTKLWGVFSAVSPLTLVSVILIFILSQIILSFRWWIFMRAWEIHIRFWMAVKLTFLGLYFSNFMPSSIGGDLVRAWYVAKHTHKRMASVISVAVDRILALFSTLVLASLAFWLAGNKEMFRKQDASGFFDNISRLKMPIIIVGIVVAAIGLAILLSPIGRKKSKSIYNKILRHSRQAFQQTIEAALVFLKKPLLAPTAMILTFILQAMVIFSLWLLGREMGIPANLEIYLVILPVIWVAGSIPISIAGVGVVEGGLIYLFMQFGGASYDAAAALALSQRAVWIIASLPGLGVYLSGKHLPKSPDGRFSIDANDEMD